MPHGQQQACVRVYSRIYGLYQQLLDREETTEDQILLCEVLRDGEREQKLLIYCSNQYRSARHR